MKLEQQIIKLDWRDDSEITEILEFTLVNNLDGYCV